MPSTLDALTDQVLQLSPAERSKLLHRIEISLDGEPEHAAEITDTAWDEEIARRVAEMDAGLTEWIPGEEAMRRLYAIARGENTDDPAH